MNISDCPARARVRRIPVWSYADPQHPVQTGWENIPADYAWVGFAKVGETRRKFYVAADDLIDLAMWQPPEGDQGPEIGVMAKVDRNGEFVCGGYDEDAETIREGFRVHGIRLHRALLVKWYQAGILRNPA